MKPNIIVYERSKGDNYNRQTLRMETTVSENDDPIPLTFDIEVNRPGSWEILEVLVRGVYKL
ncbi:MAG: hypothetical protein C6Y22_12570 [Hapalosiphonaceae cyanobacterium JJU2]|nr:MAG: hypothetical protein C6Y22_12570 [Hapalosiphonaceae cyanobacterium JJU2]